jgi:hypothetical protein
MVWLGILLAGVVVLELLKRQRAFALATLVASVGFVLSLNFINVDGLIVRQNVERVINVDRLDTDDDVKDKFKSELDAYYLRSLSSDATPALVRVLKSPQLATVDRNELTAILACQSSIMGDEREEISWVSTHWADARAWRLLVDNQDDISVMETYQNEYGVWWVKVNGDERPCLYDPYGFD